MKKEIELWCYFKIVTNNVERDHGDHNIVRACSASVSTRWLLTSGVETSS